eukprot:2788502-Ditylum_brightwellii.AAC.1
MWLLGWQSSWGEEYVCGYAQGEVLDLLVDVGQEGVRQPLLGCIQKCPNLVHGFCPNQDQTESDKSDDDGFGEVKVWVLVWDLTAVFVEADVLGCDGFEYSQDLMVKKK